MSNCPIAATPTVTSTVGIASARRADLNGAPSLHVKANEYWISHRHCQCVIGRSEYSASTTLYYSPYAAMVSESTTTWNTAGKLGRQKQKSIDKTKRRAFASIDDTGTTVEPPVSRMIARWNFGVCAVRILLRC